MPIIMRNDYIILDESCRLPDPRHSTDRLCIQHDHPEPIHLARRNGPWVVISGPFVAQFTTGTKPNGDLYWKIPDRMRGQYPIDVVVNLLLEEETDYHNIYLPFGAAPGAGFIINRGEPSPAIVHISQDLIRPIFGPVNYTLAVEYTPRPPQDNHPPRWIYRSTNSILPFKPFYRFHEIEEKESLEKEFFGRIYKEKEHASQLT